MIKNSLAIIKKNPKIIAVFSSAILAAVTSYVEEKLWSKDYLFIALIWLALYHIILTCIENINARRAIFSLVFAIPFTATLVVGSRVAYPEGGLSDFGLRDIAKAIDYLLISFSAFIGLLSFIDKHSFQVDTNKKIDLKKHSWLVYSSIAFLCWLPLFLSYFPGGVTIDSASEIRQAIGEDILSNWHPALHVIFLAIIINPIRAITGSLTAGIATSTIVQMVLLAAIVGYVTRWLIKETKRKYIGYAILAFFSLCPVVACYSITIWKDVLFSGVFLLLFIKLYEIIKNRREKQFRFKELLTVFALLTGIAFLRNGGIIIIAVIGIVLISYFKKSRKLLSITFAIELVLIGLIQGPIYKALGIYSSPFMESMSVPAQQIAYAVKYGDVSEEEYAKLSELVDPELLKNSYTPMNGDPAKNAFYTKGTVEDKKKEFLEIWFSLLKHNFVPYVKAYIQHTYSYWYTGGPLWSIDLSHVHDEVWLKAEYEDYKLLGENVFYLINAAEIGTTGAIWGSWMGNVGFMCWWVVLSVLIFIYQKRYKLLIPFASVLAYIALLLVASPVSLIFRYVFSLLLILPIATIIYFIKPKERNDQHAK